ATTPRAASAANAKAMSMIILTCLRLICVSLAIGGRGGIPCFDPPGPAVRAIRVLELRAALRVCADSVGAVREVPLPAVGPEQLVSDRPVGLSSSSVVRRGGAPER